MLKFREEYFRFSPEEIEKAWQYKEEIRGNGPLSRSFRNLTVVEERVVTYLGTFMEGPLESQEGILNELRFYYLFGDFLDSSGESIEVVLQLYDRMQRLLFRVYASFPQCVGVSLEYEGIDKDFGNSRVLVEKEKDKYYPEEVVLYCDPSSCLSTVPEEEVISQDLDDWRKGRKLTPRSPFDSERRLVYAMVTTLFPGWKRRDKYAYVILAEMISHTGWVSGWKEDVVFEESIVKLEMCEECFLPLSCTMRYLCSLARRVVINFFSYRFSTRQYAFNRVALPELWSWCGPEFLKSQDYCYASPQLNYQFCSQALFLGKKLGCMMGTYQCRSAKRAYYYSRVKYGEVDTSLLFSVVIRYFDFFESWGFRLVSKGVYNCVIEKYEIYRSQRVLVHSPVKDQFYWDRAGLTLSVRVGLCRLHRIESCLMCSFPMISQLDKIFKDGIHGMYANLGMKVYYRQSESFLSLCDRIVSHSSYGKYKNLGISIFVMNYALLNRYLSSFYLSLEVVRAVSWIWLMGLRNCIISSARYDSEIVRYFDLVKNNEVLCMRLR